MAKEYHIQPDMSIQEAAALLNISRQAVWLAINNNKIKANKRGRFRFPLIASVLEYGISDVRNHRNRLAFAQKIRDMKLADGETLYGHFQPDTIGVSAVPE
jgi:excisionase family DNA binding protein